MLDLEKVDLSEIAHALEDRSPETTSWVDPRTGAVETYVHDDVEEEEQDPHDRGLISIEAIASHDAYGDMEEFIARVRDPRARKLLERAIAGRGAFRRFKDTLFDFPDIRQDWFRFHDARMERRAIRWLADEGLVDPEAAERAARARPDPELPGAAGAFDPLRVAGDVAEDLRALYGERLRRIVLFGSWAREDAHTESDVDLLVVLDRVDSSWEELRRMDDVLWRHSLQNDTVIAVVPVAEGDLARPSHPLLIRAQAEGEEVA